VYNETIETIRCQFCIIDFRKLSACPIHQIAHAMSRPTDTKAYHARKPPLEVAPTTLNVNVNDNKGLQPQLTSNIVAYREFSAGRYLFTVFNSCMLFSHGVVTGFPTSLPLFSQSLTVILILTLTLTLTMTFELRLSRSK